MAVPRVRERARQRYAKYERLLRREIPHEERGRHRDFASLTHAVGEYHHVDGHYAVFEFRRGLRAHLQCPVADDCAKY